MTKETLKKDWASLAGEIKKQELYGRNLDKLC